MVKNIITITSDWHNSDYYIASLNGYLCSNSTDSRLIEISSKIENFDSAQAGFILKSTYKNFPEGTIHIIAVGSVLSKKSKHLLIKMDNHYFIGNDNGVFGVLFDNADYIMELPINNSIFPELDVFLPIAIELINGKNINDIGEKTEGFKKFLNEEPIVNNDIVTCSILYFDSYGNAILNISKSRFNEITKDTSFEIWVRSKRNNINKISIKYSDVSDNDLVAVFNSLDLLEIAARDASAKQLFSLSLEDEIIIKLNVGNDNVLTMQV